MSESIFIDKSKSAEEIYISLLPQIRSLINPDEPVISGLANVCAVLKESFSKISWVGFYFARNGKLFLGPFQGKNACTIIESGKGVCGTAFLTKKTIIVDDVEKFEGHITCDAMSKSEIVVPVIANGEVCCVLDIDSYSMNAFNDTDKKFLEEIVETLKNILPLGKFIIG